MTALITAIFSNFFITLIVLGLCTAGLTIAFSTNVKSRKIDILLRHQLLFAVGIAGIYGFIMHSVFANFTASFIGWAPSPFQFEVAVANLGLGVTGLVAFFASRGYQAATITSQACFYWGAAAGHIYQMIQAHNFAPGNAGSIFYIDILLPILLISLLVGAKKSAIKLSAY